MSNKQLFYYSQKEEVLNVLTHALGAVFSYIAFGLLIQKGLEANHTITLLAQSVFGLSLIILYTSSTLYHMAKERSIRYALNILDHSAIFILIAGTYTPFCLLVFKGTLGLIYFFIAWTIALIGITLKFFFLGKYGIVSTILYVAMGWMVIFAIKPLIQQLDLGGLIWLFAGGIAYTTGAVFFSIDRLKFNHAIFHLFVLIGSFCHFIAVYYFIK